MQVINRYGDNVFPCSTLVTMTKKSVSPSGERTFTFVFLYNIIMSVTFFLGGGDRRPEVFAPSFFCVRNEMPWRSVQIIVSPRSFLHEHLRIVKMCDV